MTQFPGGSKGELWRIDFDILQGGGRWENPLMGWASSYATVLSVQRSVTDIYTYPNVFNSADFMQGTSMKFKTKEDAIHFAEKQGSHPRLFMRRSGR